MNKRLIAAALVAVALPASASVSYQWHNLTPFESGFDPSEPVEFRGLMTFDDAVVASGHLSSLDVPDGFTYVHYYSYFGLEKINYMLGMGRIPGGSARSCADANADSDPEIGQLDCSVMGETVWGGFGGVALMSLDFIGPYLRGSIRASDFEGSVTMASISGPLKGDSFVWRINDLNSDNPATWCVIQNCEGMRGYWQRTVPEPALGLYLLMLVGAIVMRRHR